MISLAREVPGQILVGMDRQTRRVSSGRGLSSRMPANRQCRRMVDAARSAMPPTGRCSAVEVLTPADEERLRVLLPQRRVVRDMAATEGRLEEHEARKKVVVLMQQQIGHCDAITQWSRAARCNKMRLKNILLLPIQLGACLTSSRRQARTRRRKNNA